MSQTFDNASSGSFPPISLSQIRAAGSGKPNQDNVPFVSQTSATLSKLHFCTEWCLRSRFQLSPAGLLGADCDSLGISSFQKATIQTAENLV